MLIVPAVQGYQVQRYAALLLSLREPRRIPSRNLSDLISQPKFPFYALEAGFFPILSNLVVAKPFVCILILI
jgi:hypothetical protein